jgi:hypothetical protein
MRATTDVSLDEWTHIIRGEFSEMPGLRLTRPQARRLWGLDAATCDAALDALVDEHFLRRTPHGEYLRADAGIR